ncbi:MAG: hypothetical protein LBK94_07640 [Prevotellaceae bacterium]|nr:hypothetical protein [Prevotellaceae bacterium]
MLLIFAVACCFSVAAQDDVSSELHGNIYSQMLKQARQLHREYRFAEAIDICENIVNSHTSDSDILDSARLQIIVSENSRNLVNYIFEPKIAGKRKIEINSFISIYDSLKNGYFAPVSGSMLMDADKGNEHSLPVTFYPNSNSKNANVIYFSSYGRDGKTGLDIYKINRIDDTVWSEPELLEATVNTQFDEIYPYLAEDGKTLYFASNGHYGMGGFDLFKCTFDEKKGTWMQAENLGFPFSSPYDEFLYIPDNNNEFACLSSTRNCDEDDIFVYKTEVAINPKYKSVADHEELQQIAILDVAVENTEEDEHVEINIEGLKNNEVYIQLLKAARYYNGKFNCTQKSLDSLRDKISDIDNSERQDLENQILNRENELFDMQSVVSQLSIYISQSEFDFITKGIQPTLNDGLKSVVNFDIPIKKEIKVNIEVFGKQTYGNLQSAPDIKIQSCQPSEQDMFRFTVNGKIIVEHDYILPDDLVYRIQIISVPVDKKIEQEFFKNCSPITTEVYKNVRRYYAGLFRKQTDAEMAMAQLKTLGFKDIFISAWNNKKAITLREAKNMESKQKLTTAKTSPETVVGINKIYRITVGPINEQKSVIELINKYADGKDISKKINSDNKIVYSIGNFTTFEQAVDLCDRLVANKITDVNVNELTINN